MEIKTVNCITGEVFIRQMTPEEESANTPAPKTQSEINLDLINKISFIERDTLMNRATREFMILIAEQQGTSLGLTSDQLYLANPAYKAVKDTDNQIVSLRSQIV
jgi:hypothetical protein